MNDENYLGRIILLLLTFGAVMIGGWAHDQDIFSLAAGLCALGAGVLCIFGAVMAEMDRLRVRDAVPAHEGAAIVPRRRSFWSAYGETLGISTIAVLIGLTVGWTLGWEKGKRDALSWVISVAEHIKSERAVAPPPGDL
ncbi:MAG: hypothetical protein K2X45_07965 [Phreatobacter sp.]|nr:hypothetical protein [Phreatobacter sp.]